MTLSKTIAKNITANYFGVIGQMVIAFFLSPFLVHTLGDTKYGIWTVVAALSGYMSLLDLGIGSALTRYVSKYYQKKDFSSINTLLSSSLFLFLVISVVIVSLSPFIANLMVRFLNVDQELKDTIHLLVIMISFDVSLFVISGVFRGAFAGFQRFEILNIARLGSLLFKAIIWFQFLTYENGLITMGAISILSNILVISFYFILLKKYYQFIRYEIDLIEKKQIKSVFNYSKFIFIAMLANQLLHYSSSFVIGYYMSAAAIAYYSIPWTLAEYIKQLCLAMSRSYIPAFSELESAGDNKAIYRYYISGTRFIMMLSNLFCVGMIVYGDTFIQLWIGEKYAQEAQPLLLPLFIVLYFFVPQLIGYALLQGISKHQSYALWNVGVSILSLILSIIFVQEYGLVGVAIGVALPQIVYFGFIIPVYVNRLIGQSSVKYYAATHLSLIIPSLLLYAILFVFKQIYYPDGYLLLISQAAVATAAYLIAIYIFMLNQHEAMIVRQVFLRIYKKIV